MTGAQITEHDELGIYSGEFKRIELLKESNGRTFLIFTPMGCHGESGRIWWFLSQDDYEKIGKALFATAPRCLHPILDVADTQYNVHENAIQHGWWEDSNPHDANTAAAKIALMHSELSEALEAVRLGNPQDEHCPEFSSLDIELADAVIRIMDFAEARKIDLAAAIAAKHAYNITRPYRHGAKAC